ncbi:MAG: hypothetical protein HFI09_01625 [Bacilli bacterium]|nr:hypothetical protein [Bacilli bacterium]
MEKNNMKKQQRSIIVTLLICIVLIVVIVNCYENKEFKLDNSNTNIATMENLVNKSIPTSSFVYLSDIPYEKDKSSVGWGSITLDANLESSYNNGLITLIVNGKAKKFLKGISAHATSTVIYNIEGYDYDYLSMYYGVDASRGNNGNGVKFAIETSLDGENWTLHTPVNPAIKKGTSEADYLEVDVRDKKYIRLRCADLGNKDSDHCAYGNAKLYKEGYQEESDKPYEFIKTIEEYDEILRNASLEESVTVHEQMILQRKLVAKFGYDLLQSYAHLDEAHKETVEWLMTDLDALRYYVTGGNPMGSYMKSFNVLHRLYTEHKEDIKNTTRTEYTVLGDLYKRMMISLSLTHSGSVCLWIDGGQCSDANTRYEIYKKMDAAGLLNRKIFETLNIEEMRWVMNNNIDDEEIEWLNYYVKRRGGSIDPYTYINYTFGYNYNLPQYYSQENYSKWDEKYGLSQYKITYQTGKPKLWIVFEQGSVCGGLSKTGSNILGSFGIPSGVIGQPGHAAYLQYSETEDGQGMWAIYNDVSGWTQSEKGERLLAGWGSNNWDSYYQVSYVPYTQEALNDIENYIKANETMILASLYQDDVNKLEEIYRKALEYQSINMEAWYGLIDTYKKNTEKTSEDYMNLVKELADAMYYFPLPMYDLLNLIKPKLNGTAYAASFTNYQRISLEKGRALNASNSTLNQPSISRVMANYLLGHNDYTIASFSFDGNNAKKIVLGSKYEGSGVRWDYSLDGGNTWTATSESSVTLSEEEIASITEENDIYVHIIGVNYDAENLYKIDITKGVISENTLFGNDLENRVIGVNATYEWRRDEFDEWKSYAVESPDNTGDKKLQVRVGATGTKLPSNVLDFTFTEDNQPETRKYVSVSHLSISGVSSEATSNGGAARNAIDGNYNTRYHSAWNGSDTQRFIAIKLDEPKFVSSVEYVPAGGGNGKIIDGIIWGSMDGEEWFELTRQTNLRYTNSADNLNDAISNIKDFAIEEPVKVQYIKIEASRASNGNWFAAREFNIYEDKTIVKVADFSFDGEKGGKISLEEDYQGRAFQYSIDGGATWKSVTENSYALSEEEINQINEENGIKIKLDGEETEHLIKIRKGEDLTLNPYVNDLENRLIGLNNVEKLEWKIEDGEWTSYQEQEPVVIGTKKLYVRRKATRNVTASDALEYDFTEDNQPNTRKYIPIKHLSIHGYSTQSIDTGRPFYAPNAIDGNVNTLWHTDFRYSVLDSEIKPFITIKLDESKYLSAVEFIQTKYRSIDPDFIKNLTVYVSMDGENWTEAGKILDCPRDNELRKIEFDTSMEATYVKLEMETYDMFASLAMVNLFEDTTKEEIPTGEIRYSTTNLTNQNVTATLIVADNITVLNNGGEKTYTFTNNDEFTFEIENARGTKGYVTATVSWIDKEAPTAEISYSTTNPTNEDVVVTLINPSEEITILNNNGLNIYTFTENGEFEFEIQDKAGNTSKIKAVVNNIDKEAPKVTISYSTTTPTKGTVSATLNCDKKIKITNNNGQSVYTFKENGSFEFVYEDEFGNVGRIKATVDWIIKDSQIKPEIPVRPEEPNKPVQPINPIVPTVPTTPEKPNDSNTIEELKPIFKDYLVEDVLITLDTAHLEKNMTLQKQILPLSVTQVKKYGELSEFFELYFNNNLSEKINVSNEKITMFINLNKEKNFLGIYKIEGENAELLSYEKVANNQIKIETTGLTKYLVLYEDKKEEVVPPVINKPDSNINQNVKTGRTDFSLILIIIGSGGFALLICLAIIFFMNNREKQTRSQYAYVD